MTPLFPPEIIAESQSDTPRLMQAVEILFPDGPVRYHTALGEYVIDGNTYTGIGELGKIEPVTQSSNTGPNGLKLALNGLDSTLVSGIINTKTRGSNAKIMLCSYDDDMKITAAINMFSGRVSTTRYAIGDSAVIEVELVDRMADWDRRGARRFNSESHKAEFPNDNFFRFVPQMAEKELRWGDKVDGKRFDYR